MSVDSFLVCFFLFCLSCTTLPEVKHKTYLFPKKTAFLKDVPWAYQKIGLVRSKVNYQTLDPAHEENELCRNYFNKAVSDLVSQAKEQGADAVIQIQSVVFLEDGTQEVYSTPECADDGMEGQSLAQGVAVKWIQEKKDRVPTGIPAD